jgi:hypothetical protein
MADLSLAMQLAPYTDELISSQFSVLESKPFGFSFEGLIVRSSGDKKGSSIANHLMDEFLHAGNDGAVLLEYSVSEIDTSRAAEVHAKLIALVQDLAIREHWTLREVESNLASIGHVSRRLASGYLRSYISDSAENAKLDTGTPLDPEDIDMLDVGSLVRALTSQTDDADIHERAQAIERDVAESVILRADRNDGVHSGVNIRVTEILQDLIAADRSSSSGSLLGWRDDGSLAERLSNIRQLH